MFDVRQALQTPKEEEEIVTLDLADAFSNTQTQPEEVAATHTDTPTALSLDVVCKTEDYNDDTDRYLHTHTTSLGESLLYMCFSTRIVVTSNCAVLFFWLIPEGFHGHPRRKTRWRSLSQHNWKISL